MFNFVHGKRKIPPDVAKANGNPKGRHKKVYWVRPLLSAKHFLSNRSNVANLGEGGLPGTNSFSSSSSSTTLPFSSCSNMKVINYKVADQLSRQEIFSHLNTFFGAWFWVVTHLFTWRGEYENFSEIFRIFEKMPETFVSWLEKNNHRGVSDNQELVIVSVTFKDVLDVEKYLLQLLRWHRFRHLLDSRHNPRGNDWPKHWNSDRFWFVCVQTVWVSHGNWKK